MTDSKPTQGYELPNHTQVPNRLFDEHLPLMSEAELKVVLFAIRKIIGWHKTAPEPISQSQFMSGTGLTRASVKKGISKAIERGLLKIATPGGSKSSTLYVLNLVEGAKIYPPSEDQNLSPQKKEVQNKKDSGASAPVAHEGQSDGISVEQIRKIGQSFDTSKIDGDVIEGPPLPGDVVDKVLWSMGLTAPEQREFLDICKKHNADPYEWAYTLARLKPSKPLLALAKEQPAPTPDAGKATPANGATAEPVPEKKPDPYAWMATDELAQAIQAVFNLRGGSALNMWHWFQCHKQAGKVYGKLPLPRAVTPAELRGFPAWYRTQEGAGPSIVTKAEKVQSFMIGYIEWLDKGGQAAASTAKSPEASDDPRNRAPKETA